MTVSLQIFRILVVYHWVKLLICVKSAIAHYLNAFFLSVLFKIFVMQPIRLGCWGIIDLNDKLKSKRLGRQRLCNEVRIESHWSIKEGDKINNFDPIDSTLSIPYPR